MPFARSFQTKMDSEVNCSVDNVLELAIDFAVRGCYRCREWYHGNSCVDVPSDAFSIYSHEMVLHHVYLSSLQY